MYESQKKEIILYRLIYGHHAINVNEPLQPVVPSNHLDDENTSFPRLCTSTSLDGCLTSLGPHSIGIEYLQSKSSRPGADIRNVTLPYTLLRFQLDCNNPKLLLPNEVAKYVADAIHTQEHWIIKPICPCEVSHVWLVGGRVTDSSLLLQGIKFSYYIISDTEWSNSIQTVNPEFEKQIFSVTKKWLKRAKTMHRFDNPSPSPLSAKISSTVNRSTCHEHTSDTTPHERSTFHGQTN